MRSVLSDNYGVIERANGHVLLIDGGAGDKHECGVIFLNESWAFYDKQIVRQGYPKALLKKALAADGSFDDSNRRDIWPGKYQRIRFYEAEE
jgi:hypothetical protein